MPEFEDKPDDEFFAQANEYLKNKWSDTHRDWIKRDSFYRRDYDVWNNPADNQNRSKYRPSTSTSIIDHAADTQLAFAPKVHRPPPRPNNQTSKGWSDQIENIMKDILDDASMQQTNLPFKALGKFLLHLGYGQLELGWDKNDREGPDGKTYNPVRLMSPHPSDVLLDPDEKSPTLGIKRMEMRASRLQAWTEALANPIEGIERPDVTVFKIKKNPFEMIKLEHLWTPFWTMLRLHSGEPLFTMKNEWGFVPWPHAFAGYGMEMTDSDKRDPLNNAQGLLSPILDTIKASAQAQSAKHQKLLDLVYPKPGSSQDPETVAAMLERGLLEGEKVDFWFMEQVQLGREIFEVGREYSQEMAEGTYNRGLTGARQEGVDTVGQQAILSNAAQKKFNVPAVQMQFVSSIIASNILRLIDITGVPIGINGKKITREMIEGDYTVSVTFETPDPVLGIQKREIGMREVVAGLKSPERYWREDADLEDISAEREALDRALVDTHPAIIHVRSKRAAIEMGEDLDAAIAELAEDEAAAKASANGTVPRAGTEGTRGPQ
ncbi:hypothetical protein LCGC14_2148900, partial [marine sediment metagenome]